MVRLVEKLQARANAQVERELRAAIMRLADLQTDVEIDQYATTDDGEQDRLRDEDLEIRVAAGRLRNVIAYARMTGRMHLGEDDEKALRLAKEGRRARAARARQHTKPAATVTPARPAPRQLPASTKPSRPRKAPPASKGTIHVGGQTYLALGPGDTKGGR